MVPGASAGIALAIGACIARGDGAAMESLPLRRRSSWRSAGTSTSTRAAPRWPARGWNGCPTIEAALARRPAAILHPAHLDGAALGIDQVAPLARAAGVPLVVDAAFQCFPVASFARWAGAGDLACFSAKYFAGPNGGGFVAGRRGGRGSRGLDFVGYESGRWRTLGRAFKLDRARAARWWRWTSGSSSITRRGAGNDDGRRGAARCGRSLKQFTLDERLVDGPVNAVVLPGAAAMAGRWRRATRACARWSTATRSCSARRR